jgi:hypothetical protein
MIWVVCLKIRWMLPENKTEDTNKLTLLVFKIIACRRHIRRVRWTSFCFPACRVSWKAHVLQTWRQSKNVWQRFCYRYLKRGLCWPTQWKWTARNNNNPHHSTNLRKNKVRSNLKTYVTITSRLTTYPKKTNTTTATQQELYEQEWK